MVYLAPTIAFMDVRRVYRQNISTRRTAAVHLGRPYPTVTFPFSVPFENSMVVSFGQLHSGTLAGWLGSVQRAVKEHLAGVPWIVSTSSVVAVARNLRSLDEKNRHRALFGASFTIPQYIRRAADRLEAEQGSRNVSTHLKRKVLVLGIHQIISSQDPLNIVPFIQRLGLKSVIQMQSPASPLFKCSALVRYAPIALPNVHSFGNTRFFTCYCGSKTKNLVSIQALLSGVCTRSMDFEGRTDVVIRKMDVLRHSPKATEATALMLLATESSVVRKVYINSSTNISTTPRAKDVSAAIAAAPTLHDSLIVVLFRRRLAPFMLETVRLPVDLDGLQELDLRERDNKFERVLIIVSKVVRQQEVSSQTPPSRFLDVVGYKTTLLDTQASSDEQPKDISLPSLDVISEEGEGLEPPPASVSSTQETYSQMHHAPMVSTARKSNRSTPVSTTAPGAEKPSPAKMPGFIPRPKSKGVLDKRLQPFDNFAQTIKRLEEEAQRSASKHAAVAFQSETVTQVSSVVDFVPAEDLRRSRPSIVISHPKQRKAEKKARAHASVTITTSGLSVHTAKAEQSPPIPEGYSQQYQIFEPMHLRSPPVPFQHQEYIASIPLPFHMPTSASNSRIPVKS